MSNTFDELCEAQIEKISEIRKIELSYKKTAKNNRTLQLISNKLQKLEEIWDSFKKTDCTIKDHQDFHVEDEYNKKGCYNKAKEWYELVKLYLEEEIKSLDPKPSKSISFYNIPATKNTKQQPDNHSNEQVDEPDEAQEELTNIVQYKLQEDRCRAISTITKAITPDILATATRIYLEQKIKSLQKHWDAFEEGHKEIISTTNPKDLERNYFKDNIYLITETEFMDTLINLQEVLFTRFSSITNETHHLTQNDELQTNTCFSLSQASSFIPTFSGASRDLHKFITSCDDMYDTASTTAEKRSLLSLIRSKLSAEAYDVFRYNQISGWPELKEILNQTFETKIPRTILQSQLSNCRQNLGESVKDFLQRLHIIFSKLNEATYLYTCDNLLLNSLLRDNENQAVRTMEDGLIDAQLQTLAKVYAVKTFSSLKSYILEHSSRLPLNLNINNREHTNFNRNFKSNLRCFKCNKFGHIAPKCTAVQNFYTGSSRTDNPQFQTPRPPLTKNYPTSANTPECRYCHRVGHSIEECRTRATNNARFNNTKNINLQRTSSYPQVAKDPPLQRFQEKSSFQNNGTFPRYGNANISTQDQSLMTQSDINSENTSNQGNEMQRGVNFGDSSHIQMETETEIC